MRCRVACVLARPAGAKAHWPIHRDAPPFVEQSTEQEILTTGIKVCAAGTARSTGAARWGRAWGWRVRLQRQAAAEDGGQSPSTSSALPPLHYCSRCPSQGPEPLCSSFRPPSAQVVDLLAPYQKGGKIGLFGGAGVGKTVLIMELINNVAKAHGQCLGGGRQGLERRG